MARTQIFSDHRNQNTSLPKPLGVHPPSTTEYPSNAVPQRGRIGRPKGRKNTTVEQRRRIFEQDIWALYVTERSAICAGCECAILLDKRTPFSYENFEKHKGRCPEIRRKQQEFLDEDRHDRAVVENGFYTFRCPSALGTRNMNASGDMEAWGGPYSIGNGEYRGERNPSTEIMEAASALLLLACRV